MKLKFTPITKEFKTEKVELHITHDHGDADFSESEVYEIEYEGEERLAKFLQWFKEKEEQLDDLSAGYIRKLPEDFSEPFQLLNSEFEFPLVRDRIYDGSGAYACTGLASVIYYDSEGNAYEISWSQGE